MTEMAGESKDKKAEILKLILIIIVSASVVFTFYNTVIWQNYELVESTE